MDPTIRSPYVFIVLLGMVLSVWTVPVAHAQQADQVGESARAYLGKPTPTQPDLATNVFEVENILNEPIDEADVITMKVHDEFSGPVAGSAWMPYTLIGLGTYTNINGSNGIKAPSQFGIKDDRFIGLQSNDGKIKLELEQDATYLGMAWPAGDAGNLVEFYEGGEKLFEYKTDNITKFLDGGNASIEAGDGSIYNADDYYGQPATGATRGDRQNNGEPYAYVHFVATEGLAFDEVRFSQTTGGGFETDNHSVYYGATPKIPDEWADIDQASSVTLTGPPSVNQNEVSETVTLTVRDALGNEAAVDEPTTFNLSSTGTGTFYENADGTGSTTSVTLAAGESTYTLYYESGGSGTHTLEATENGGTSNPALQGETGAHDVNVISDTDAPTTLTLDTPSSMTIRQPGQTLDVGYSYTEPNPDTTTITFDDGAGNTASFGVDDALYAGDNTTKTVTLDLSSPKTSAGNGLVDGTTYDITVQTTDWASNSTSTTGANLLRIDGSAPPPPTLTATAGPGGDIDLSWTDVNEGTTTYSLRRSTTAGSGYAEITTATDDGGGYSYTDTGVTEGTTYYYVVVPIDGVGNEGAPSNEDAATADATGPIVTITNPADGATLTSPQGTIDGTSSDNVQVDGVALTIQRSDGQYWTGSGWASGTTTVAATAVNGAFDTDSENWTYDASGITGDDTYDVTAEAVDIAGNASSPAALSYTIEATAPEIATGTLGGDNGVVDVTFSEAAYTNSGGSGALTTGDLTIAGFSANGGAATGVSITGVTATDGSALAGGETIVRLQISVTGGPASGGETFEVQPADGTSIYDGAGNAMAGTETTGPLTLTDQVPPTIAGVTTRDRDGDGQVDAADVVFSEPVDDSEITPGDYALGGTSIEALNTTVGGDGDADDEKVQLRIPLDGGNEVAGTEAKDLTYTQGTTVDLSGTGLADVATGDVAEADAAAPVIESVVTLDRDTDGRVDAADVVFTEPVDDATLAAGDFSIGGTTVEAVASGTADDDTVQLRITTDANEVAGTDAKEVTYAPGTTADGAGNTLTAVAPGDLTENDGAKPTITGLEITDTAADGRVDEVTLTFSEFVDTDDSAAPVAADAGTITLPDGSTADLSSASLTDPAGTAATVTVSGIAGQATPNTAAGAADIADDLSGNWTDGTGNGLVPTLDDESVTDSAAPVATQITRGSPTAETITASSVDFGVAFSESVSAIDTGDFALGSTPSGGASINTVSAATGTAVGVTVTGIGGDGTLGLDVDGTTDVQDGAGNTLDAREPSPDETYTLDSTGPTTVAVTSPADGATVAPGPTLEGSAQDNNAVASVALTIQRDGDGNYWNGGAWQGGAATVAASAADGAFDSGNEPWTYDASGITGGGDYTVTATATDEANNETTSTAGGFTISDPQQIALSGPATVTAGQASGNFTLTVQDGSGTATAVTADTEFDLASTSGGTVTFSSDPVTVPAGNASITFTYEDTEAGSPTLTATAQSPADGGLSGEDATAPITVEAGAISASQSTVTANPSTVTANGTDTSTLTIVLTDDNGNPIGGLADGDFALAGLSAAAAGTVSETGTAGTYEADLTNTTAEDITVTVTADGTTLDDTPSITFEAGSVSASNSSVAASPSTVTANGTDASTLTIELQDNSGNPIGGLAGGDFALSGLGDATAGTVTETATAGTYEATLTNTTAEGITVTVTADGTPLNDTPSVTFESGPAASVAIATQPTTTPAGKTVSGLPAAEVTDAQGNPVSGISVTISESGGYTFDGGTRTAPTDASGTATFGDLVIETAAPGYRLTAAIDGADAGVAASDNAQSAPFAVTAAGADETQATIAAADAAITANGTSTTEITVQLKDEYGNPLTTGGDNVTASTTAGSLSGVTDNGDGTYSATLTSSTSVETATLTGTVNGSPITDDAAVGFVSGAAAQLAFTTQPTDTDAGQTMTNVVVQLQDDNGNVVENAGIPISLALSDGVPLDGTTTVQTDASGTATFTDLSVEQAGTGYTLTAAGGGVADETSVSFAIRPGPADATASTIAAADPSITADGASTTAVTIQLSDQYGNNLTSGGDNVTASTTAGSLSGVTDNADGTYGATLTSSTTAETATITGTVNGPTIDDDATVDFTPGAISASVSSVTASPSTVTANGTDSSTLTIELKDGTGNPIGGLTGGDFSLSGLGNATAGTVTETATSGTYEADLTNTTAEQITVDVTADGTPLDDTPSVTFEAGAISASTSSVTGTSPHTANGTDASTITIALADAQNNPVGGLADDDFGVGLTGTASAGPVAETATPGTYEVAVTDATAETVTATITANGTTLDDTPTIAFQAGTISASKSSVTASPSTVTANGTDTSTLTIELKDGTGNPIGGLTGGDFSLSGLGNATAGTVTETATSGTYEATLTNTTAEAITAAVEADGTPLDDTPSVTFVAGAISASASSVTASPSTVTADGTDSSTLTIELRDGTGNPIGGLADGNFALGGLSNAIASSVTETATSGTYEATLTNTTAEAITVAVTADGTALDDTPSVTFEAGGATAITVSTQPSDATAGQSIPGPPTATVTDAQGNPVPGVDVTVVESGGYAFDAGTETVTTDGSGEAAFSDLMINTAGTGYQLDVSIDGDDANVSADADAQSAPFAVTAGSPAALAYGQQPTDATTQDPIAPPVTVRIKDAYDNLVETATDEVTLALGTDPGGAAPLGGTTSKSAVDGVATFDDLIVDEGGTGYTLSATTTGGLGPTESAAFTVTDDTAPPQALSLDEPASTVVKSLGSGGPTDLEVVYSYTEDNPDAATITLDDGAGNTAAYTVDDSAYPGDNSPRTVTLDLTAPDTEAGEGLQDGGTYDLIVEATDTQDNTAEDRGTDRVRIDDAAPQPGSLLEVNTVVFNGLPTDSLYSKPPSPTLDNLEAMTLEMWLWPGSLPDAYLVVEKAGADPEASQFRVTGSGNTLQVEFYVGTDTVRLAAANFFQRDQTRGAASTKDGSPTYEWAHLAVAVGGDGETAALYRNGTLLDRTPMPGAMNGGGAPLNVGTGYDGEVHEIRVWSTQRTQAQIQSLLTRALGDDTPNLVEYHRFRNEDQTFSAARDRTANANDLFLSSSVEREFRTLGVPRPQMPEDSEYIISFKGEDKDGGPVTARITSTPAEGTLYQMTDGDTIPAAEITGPVAVSDPNNRVFYRPNPDYNGPDQFDYVLRDETGNQAAATTEMTVTPVNDAPRLSASEGDPFPFEGTTRIDITQFTTDVDHNDDELEWTATALIEGLRAEADNQTRELVLESTGDFLVNNKRTPIQITVRDPEAATDVDTLRVNPKTLSVDYEMGPNYPNPAVGNTTIEYAVPEPSDVTIHMFDLLGRRVTTLVDGTVRRGVHTVQVNVARRGLASGTYFYRMNAESRSSARRFRELRRMVIVK